MVNLRHIAIVAWLGVSAILVALCYALIAGDFQADGSRLLENPWGVATLVDVYVGFALFSCWVAWRESQAASACVWIAAIALMGNLVSTIYVLLALRTSQGDFEHFWHGSRRPRRGRGPGIQMVGSEVKKG